MKPTINWRVCAIFALLATMLLIPTATEAGGWAIVTMERLPRTVRAGEAIELRFIARQHGRHPVHLEQAALVISQGGGERLRFEAEPIEPKGYHRVEVTFPQDGVWDWYFDLAPFPSTMNFAPLTVLPATGARSETKNWFVGWLRGVVMRSQTTNLALDDDAAYGHALFLAKGCAACHEHDEASYGWTTSLGPDLTRYNPDPLFLRSWLRNAGVLTERLQWGMPTLELSDEEIEALIVFLAQNPN